MIKCAKKKGRKMNPEKRKKLIELLGFKDIGMVERAINDVGNTIQWTDKQSRQIELIKWLKRKNNETP